MSAKIEKISSEGLQSVYSVEIPAETVEEHLNNEAQKKCKNFHLRGFRPGHVPLSIVRNRLKAEIHHDALDKIVSEACMEILNESKTEELAVRPTYKTEEGLEDNKDFKFTLTIEVAPTFELKPYDFELSKVIPNVPQSDIEEFRKKIIENNPIWEDAGNDYIAQTLDKITYKASCFKDGKPEPTSDINKTIIIPSVVEDDKFVSSLIGKKIGDTFDFVQDEKSEVSYKVKIENIQKSVKNITPEDYATKIGFKNLSEWDEYIKKDIERNINAQAYLYHKSQIIEALMKEYSFDLPKSVVEQETKIVLQQIKAERARSKNLGEKIEDKTDEELKVEYADTIDKRVLLGYIFNKIAKKENIVATDDELSRAVYAEISNNPSFATQIVNYYKNNPGALAYKRAEITEHKVISFIVSHVKTKDEAMTLKEIEDKIKKLLEEDENVQPNEQ